MDVVFSRFLVILKKRKYNRKEDIDLISNPTPAHEQLDLDCVQVHLSTKMLFYECSNSYYKLKAVAQPLNLWKTIFLFVKDGI